MPQLRTLHHFVGIIGLLAFLLTGQYMLWVHHHLHGMPDGPRMFFRSAHIYLLWSSLLNLLLGCYVFSPDGKRAARLQLLASGCILIAPAMLSYSFFVEQYAPTLLRPAGRWAIYLSAIGVLIHALAVRLARKQAGMALAANIQEHGRVLYRDGSSR